MSFGLEDSKENEVDGKEQEVSYILHAESRVRGGSGEY